MNIMERFKRITKILKEKKQIETYPVLVQDELPECPETSAFVAVFYNTQKPKIKKLTVGEFHAIVETVDGKVFEYLPEFHSSPVIGYGETEEEAVSCLFHVGALQGLIELGGPAGSLGRMIKRGKAKTKAKKAPAKSVKGRKAKRPGHGKKQRKS